MIKLKRSRRVRYGARLACLAGSVLLLSATACQMNEHVSSASSVRHTVPTYLQVPHAVQRLAVLYGTSSDQEEMKAYQRLEGAAFQFKAQRPSLRIFERSHMPAILREQQFQVQGRVSEDTAVRVGRLLGVDSVLIYDIQGPSHRDRIFASTYREIPPYLVTSKIIRVESAEIVFHNVVTAPVWPPSDSAEIGLASDFRARPLIRAALDRGVMQTIADLGHAFR